MHSSAFLALNCARHIFGNSAQLHSMGKIPLLFIKTDLAKNKKLMSHGWFFVELIAMILDLLFRGQC